MLTNQEVFDVLWDLWAFVCIVYWLVRIVIVLERIATAVEDREN